MKGLLNDLWVFNFDSRERAWISGSTTVNQRAVYGIRGQSDAGNVPGARERFSAAIDTLFETLYLFGGQGYDSSWNNAGRP